MILRFNVVVRTPSPPTLIEQPTQVSQTPSNAREPEAQSTLVRERIQRHQSLSPASIIKSLGRHTKGAKVIIHTAALLGR